MIAVIGSGYIGSEFTRQLRTLGFPNVSVPNSHAAEYITNHSNIELVINAAAYIPATSVADCDKNACATMIGNVIFPSQILALCQASGIPMAHISTGCLWSDGQWHTEDDAPQREFVGHCGFYIGTKVMSERIVRLHEQHYIWRVRLPFDHLSHPRNYLSKLAAFSEIFDHDNSLSHRGDFVRACLELWQLRAPYGTYNVMNTGSMKARAICDILIEEGIRKDSPKLVPGPQGGCLVSNKKLRDSGVRMRSVEEAILEAINEWRTDV